MTRAIVRGTATMYMRKKKFMQEDSAISGLLPKLVHNQYFLPILVAAAGWQKLSKVLQQNTDMAKSLLEAGEWSDLINKLHEEGNWDAYRVGFNHYGIPCQGQT